MICEHLGIENEDCFEFAADLFMIMVDIGYAKRTEKHVIWKHKYTVWRFKNENRKNLA